MEVEIAGEFECFPHIPLKEKEVPPLPNTAINITIKFVETILGSSTNILDLDAIPFCVRHLYYSVQLAYFHLRQSK